MKAKRFHELVKPMRGRTWPSWATLPDDASLELRIAREMVRPPPRTRLTTRYSHYLASPGWLMRRFVVMVLARRRCAECGSAATEVHHLNYARKGGEWLSDLLPLCDPCHRNKHPEKSMWARGTASIRARA